MPCKGKFVTVFNVTGSKHILACLAGAKFVTIFNVTDSKHVLACLAGAKFVTIFNVTRSKPLLACLAGANFVKIFNGSLAGLGSWPFNSVVGGFSSPVVVAKVVVLHPVVVFFEVW